MRKTLVTALFLIFATGVWAETLIETFDDPLGGWRDRWLALNTNMQNYYVVAGEPDENYRGNNPCGIWIHDGDAGSPDCAINFEPSFGATVSYFEISIEAYSDLTLTIFDMVGDIVDSVFIPNNHEEGDSGCNCQAFGFTTPNGLGSFTMVGVSVEGNTAIDDVTVTADFDPAQASSWSSLKSLF